MGWEVEVGMGGGETGGRVCSWGAPEDRLISVYWDDSKEEPRPISSIKSR